MSFRLSHLAILLSVVACQDGTIDIVEQGRGDAVSLLVLGSDFRSWSGYEISAVGAEDELAVDYVEDGFFGLEFFAPDSIIDGALVLQVFVDVNNNAVCDFGADIAGTLTFEADLLAGDFFAEVTPANFENGPCPEL